MTIYRAAVTTVFLVILSATPQFVFSQNVDLPASSSSHQRSPHSATFKKVSFSSTQGRDDRHDREMRKEASQTSIQKALALKILQALASEGWLK